MKNLIQECSKLDSRDVKWLMTQTDTESIRDLFKEYNIEEIKVYRMRRKKYVTELVIKNF
jgi:UDP-N-acetylglucosamine:LPS N-acetylglucosamine transferase